MTRSSTKTYLFILAVLVLLLSASRITTQKTRGSLASFAAPFWERLSEARIFFQSPLSYFSREKYTSKTGLPLSPKEEILRLQMENKILRSEVIKLQDILQREKFLATWSKEENESEADTLSLPKHKQDLRRLLKLQQEIIPAHVIFRSRLSWSNSLWINVGEEDNEALGQSIIAKNSPVLVGISVVGVVDYVGRKQSRVRLITDSGLTPSVRAARGAPQNRLLIHHIDTLLERMNKHLDLLSNEEYQDIQIKLIDYRERLMQPKETWLLAKGELQGCCKNLWRGQNQTLKGIGFNYDYADEEGPARELRSGKSVDPHSKQATLPILKMHDLLITTGMDGVFPPGLYVAEITKINPLREGDYFYELEAKPTAGHLDELTTVFVMRPVGYDKSEKAPLSGY